MPIIELSNDIYQYLLGAIILQATADDVAQRGAGNPAFCVSIRWRSSVKRVRSLGG
jgi:hypothetical protein